MLRAFVGAHCLRIIVGALLTNALLSVNRVNWHAQTLVMIEHAVLEICSRTDKTLRHCAHQSPQSQAHSTSLYCVDDWVWPNNKLITQLLSDNTSDLNRVRPISITHWLTDKWQNCINKSAQKRTLYIVLHAAYALHADSNIMVCSWI